MFFICFTKKFCDRAEKKFGTLLLNACLYFGEYINKKLTVMEVRSYLIRKKLLLSLLLFIIAQSSIEMEAGSNQDTLRVWKDQGIIFTMPSNYEVKAEVENALGHKYAQRIEVESPINQIFLWEGILFVEEQNHILNIFECMGENFEMNESQLCQLLHRIHLKSASLKKV